MGKPSNLQPTVATHFYNYKQVGFIHTARRNLTDRIMKAVVLLVRSSSQHISGQAKQPILRQRFLTVQSGTHADAIMSIEEKKNNRLGKKSGTLCLRQWADKPYRSPQESILEVPANMCIVQPLILRRNGLNFTAEVEGHPVKLEDLARNDGG